MGCQNIREEKWLARERDLKAPEGAEEKGG